MTVTKWVVAMRLLENGVFQATGTIGANGEFLTQNPKGRQVKIPFGRYFETEEEARALEGQLKPQILTALAKRIEKVEQRAKKEQDAQKKEKIIQRISKMKTLLNINK